MDTLHCRMPRVFMHVHDSPTPSLTRTPQLSDCPLFMYDCPIDVTPGTYVTLSFKVTSYPQMMHQNNCSNMFGYCCLKLVLASNQA